MAISTGSPDSYGSPSGSAISTGSPDSYGSPSGVAISTGSPDSYGSPSGSAISTGSSDSYGSPSGSAISTGSPDAYGSPSGTAISTGSSDSYGSPSSSAISAGSSDSYGSPSGAAIPSQPSYGPSSSAINPRSNGFSPPFQGSYRFERDSSAVAASAKSLDDDVNEGAVGILDLYDEFDTTTTPEPPTAEDHSTEPNDLDHLNEIADTDDTNEIPVEGEQSNKTKGRKAAPLVTPALVVELEREELAFLELKKLLKNKNVVTPPGSNLVRSGLGSRQQIFFLPQ